MSFRDRVGRVSPGADLHVHTTHSDGSLTPRDVVRAAAAVGLAALAITDHDTTTALPSATDEANRLGIELIPGAEVSAGHEGRELHILAYFIEPSAPGLDRLLREMSAARRERFAEMARRLSGLGFQVDADRIRSTAYRANPGRRHLGEWLVRSGQVPDLRAAFRGPLADGGPAHVPKPLAPVATVIERIRDSGGVAALAHPPYDTVLTTLRGLYDQGLQGVEVRGPGVSPGRSARLREWADRLGLAAVAGTDFHAPGGPAAWVGAITTPPADLDRLRTLASEAALHA